MRSSTTYFAQHISNYIIMSAPLADCQHGFVKRRSTITNMLMTERVIAEALNIRGPVLMF